MPVPWPPTTTWRNRLNRAVRMVSGIAASIDPFTAPVMVPVVTAAHRPVSAGPKRSSFP